MGYQDSLHTTDETTGNRPGINWRTGMIGAVVAAAVAVGSMVAPAAVYAEPKGDVQDDAEVGYSYATFDQNPNVGLLFGGTSEELRLANPGETPPAKKTLIAISYSESHDGPSGFDAFLDASGGRRPRAAVSYSESHDGPSGFDAFLAASGGRLPRAV